MKHIDALSGRLRPVRYEDGDETEDRMLRLVVLGLVIAALCGALVGLSVHKAGSRALTPTSVLLGDAAAVRALGEKQGVRALACACGTGVSSVSVYEMSSSLLGNGSAAPIVFDAWMGAFIGKCASAAAVPASMSRAWGDLCQWIAAHTACQVQRLYFEAVPAFATFSNTLETGWRRSCVAMVAEAWHLWHKQDIMLELALNGVSSALGTPLWGDNTSATFEARTALSAATGALSGQIWPTFTILQDEGGLCGGALPSIDHAALYESLFGLCAGSDRTVLCSWVKTESDVDVALGVLAIMGSVFTLAIMVGGIVYRLARLMRNHRHHGGKKSVESSSADL